MDKTINNAEALRAWTLEQIEQAWGEAFPMVREGFDALRYRLAALAALSPTPGGRDAVAESAIIDASTFAQVNVDGDTTTPLEIGMYSSNKDGGFDVLFAPRAETRAEPAPNWCRTCGKRPNDPLAVFCSDSFHRASRSETNIGKPQAAVDGGDAVRVFGVRSERRADGGFYVVVGPYAEPRPHGLAMAAIRNTLAATPAPAVTDAWYCAKCQRTVPPHEVRYDETHTECGRYITDDHTPAPAVEREAVGAIFVLRGKRHFSQATTPERVAQFQRDNPAGWEFDGWLYTDPTFKNHIEAIRAKLVEMAENWRAGRYLDGTKALWDAGAHASDGMEACADNVDEFLSTAITTPPAEAREPVRDVGAEWYTDKRCVRSARDNGKKLLTWPASAKEPGDIPVYIASPPPAREAEALNPADLEVSAERHPPQGMHVGMPRGVRIVHKPTGTEVFYKAERSQHRNRDVCLRMLTAALASREGA